MNNNLIGKLHEMIEPSISLLGFNTVQLLLKSHNNHSVLEILIERQNGNPVSIGDCALVSRNVGVLLDVEEIMQGKYNLEVSSAGAERPLVKLQDYVRFINYDVKIKLLQPLEGQSNYKGKIIKVEDHNIYIESNNVTSVIDFNLIKSARLKFTDEMFKQMLKASSNKTK